MLTLTAASAALAAPGNTGTSAAGSGGATGRELGTRAQQAVLGLYALDSQLHSWGVRLTSFERAAANLREQRAALKEELGAARTSLRVAQRHLASDLRALYERGSVDPVAVMLGATSLTKGLQQLDVLSHVADQSRQIVAATTSARHRLLRSRVLLAAEQRRLDRSLAAAREAEQRLAASVTARQAYISSLRTQEQLRTQQVQGVEAAAQAAQQKS